jgi:nucleotide-binding universal stress UspA family protein
MYRTVVVPLDNSPLAETAVETATDLARAEDASVLLVSVSPTLATQAYLDAIAARLDVPAEARLLPDGGDGVAAAIAGLAREHPDALVCMAAHGRSRVGRAVFGSVTEELLLQLGGPLVLVGPSYRSGLAIPGRNLVVCLDGSHLAEEILPVAEQFAKAFDLHVWLVSVLPSRAEWQGDTFESGHLGTLAARIDHDRVDWEVLHGDDPAEAITDFAARLPASLVAMTTHGRTGLLRVAAGSVAMHVVHDSPCAVVMSRPGSGVT